jgi:NAD(P)-dependent dehydrogenase (short-subunit alcohol dehydrogenase family)
MNDLFSIEGKTAVVTGGSRGIGLMIASGFIDAGARVFISSRKAEVCDQVASELGERCVSVPADLSTMDGVQRLVDAVGEREDHLNILVNNAGAAWGAPLEDFPESGFDKVWNLNVKGLFYLTTKFLPLLRKAATPDDPARVINIGSIDGIRVPWFENFSYSAAKAGVHMLTRHIAHKVAAENITVNAVAPGLFPSEMTKVVFAQPETTENVVQNIPLRRHGRAEDAAGVAIFLSSRAGSYLTGAVIPVDGGVSTHG